MMTTARTDELWRPLTAAQQRVLPLIADGLTYAAMADQLGCAPRTVRAHVEAIAMLLPPSDVPAYRRVQRWAQSHRV